MMAIPWGGRYLKCRPKRRATDDAWAVTARRYSPAQSRNSMTQRPGGNEIPGIRGRLQSPLTAMACNVRGDGLDGSEGGRAGRGRGAASPQEVCSSATTTDKQLADNGGFIGGLAWDDASVPAFSNRLRLWHGHVVGAAFGIP